MNQFYWKLIYSLGKTFLYLCLKYTVHSFGHLSRLKNINSVMPTKNTELEEPPSHHPHVFIFQRQIAVNRHQLLTLEIYVLNFLLYLSVMSKATLALMDTQQTRHKFCCLVCKVEGTMGNIEIVSSHRFFFPMMAEEQQGATHPVSCYYKVLKKNI